MVSSAPSSRASLQTGGVEIGDQDARASKGARRLQSEQADHARADDERRFAALELCDANRVQGDGDGFEHGGLGKAELVGQPVDDALGNDDILGEGAVRGGSRRRKHRPPAGYRRG